MSIKTDSHEFIGWYEGYHGRDGEVAELRDEIGRLISKLDTMNNVHKHLATELADMGRERDRLRSIKTPASAKLLNITKAALDHAEAECDQLRAALAEIANNLIDSELASSEKRWMARRALAEGTKE